MEIKKLNTLISSIGRASAEVKADIQEALVGCAYFAQRDRNIDPAKWLFAAIGNEANRKAMAHWLSLNAPIHFKDGAPKLSDKRQKEFAGSMDEFEAELRSVPAWYEHATEGNKAENVWDANKELRAIAAYLDKRTKKFSEFEGADDILDTLQKAAVKLAAIANKNEFEVAK